MFTFLLVFFLVMRSATSLVIGYSRRLSVGKCLVKDNLRHFATSSSGDKPPFMVYGLHHCGILVGDVEKSKSFYLNVLGMQDISHLRPKTLPYPGAFIQCGKHQLHLMQLPSATASTPRPDYVGRDHHIAVGVSSVEAVRQRLEASEVPYMLSKSGRAAIFFRDIDGNGFEFTEDATVIP